MDTDGLREPAKPQFSEHIHSFAHSMRALHSDAADAPKMAFHRENEILREELDAVRAIPGLPRSLKPRGKTLGAVLNQLAECRPPIETDAEGRSWLAKCVSTSGRRIPFEAYSAAVSRLINRTARSNNQLRLAQRSTVMNAVAVSESFLRCVLRDFFVAHPEAALHGQLVSGAALLSGKSLEELRLHAIDEHIRTRVLVGDTRKWLSNVLAVSKLRRFEHIAKTVDRFEPRLVELVARRHLYTHADGIVDEQYLAETPADLREGLSVGDRLPMKWPYPLVAVDVCETIFLPIAYALWLKAEKADEDRAALLVNIVYERLLDRRWHVARWIAPSVWDDSSAGDTVRDIARLNRWLCMKRMRGGLDDGLKADIEAFAPTTPETELGKQALLDNPRKVFRLLRELVGERQVPFYMVDEWPILSEMRQRRAYRDFRREYAPRFEELDKQLADTQRDIDLDAGESY
jgi:hypothetical protein